jgi:hypothetical protein
LSKDQKEVIMDELKRGELVPYALVDELAMFLRTSGSTLCLSEAITRAVKFWIAAQMETAAPARGYQWKTLFLPNGTRARMHIGGECFYADVTDDQFTFSGYPSSPRQMTISVAGPGRNAWRDLWVRRPGDRDWMQADKLRRAAAARTVAQAAPQPSPTETIQAAAKSMSEALHTALLLVDQSRMQATQQVERRVEKHRRRDDQLESAWFEENQSDKDIGISS